MGRKDLQHPRANFPVPGAQKHAGQNLASGVWRALTDAVRRKWQPLAHRSAVMSL